MVPLILLQAIIQQVIYWSMRRTSHLTRERAGAGPGTHPSPCAGYVWWQLSLDHAKQKQHWRWWIAPEISEVIHCHFSHCRQYFMSGCGEEHWNSCFASTVMPEVCPVDEDKEAKEHSLDGALEAASYVVACRASRATMLVLRSARSACLWPGARNAHRGMSHRSSSNHVPATYRKGAGPCAHLDHKFCARSTSCDRVILAAIFSSREDDILHSSVKDCSTVASLDAYLEFPGWEGYDGEKQSHRHGARLWVCTPHLLHSEPIFKSKTSIIRKGRLNFGDNGLLPRQPDGAMRSGRQAVRKYVSEIKSGQNSFQASNLVMLRDVCLDLVRLTACAFGSGLVPKTTAAFPTSKLAGPEQSSWLPMPGHALQSLWLIDGVYHSVPPAGCDCWESWVRQR